MFTEEYSELEQKKMLITDEYMLKLTDQEIQEHKALLDELHLMAHKLRKGMVESLKKNMGRADRCV